MTVTELAPAYRYSPPQRIKSLSVVMTAHNRAETIEATIDRALEEAALVADQSEVVIVDDGSTDATAAIVERMAAQRGGSISLIRHDRTVEHGPSVRRGWAAARMEWLLSMDSDGQFDIGDLQRFVPLTDRADIITGWRKNLRESLSHRIGSARGTPPGAPCSIPEFMTRTVPSS